MRRLAFFLTLTFTLFISTSTTYAQQRVAFDFGVRVGIPTKTLLESDFEGVPGQFTVQRSFERSSYTVGPTFAVVLYDRLTVQLDALYKPIRFSTFETTPTAVFNQSAKGGSWEFPLVFDYRFLHGTVRPYAGGGGVVGQTISALVESQTTFNTGRIDRTFSSFESFDNQFPAYIANAGVDWTRRHVVVRPEVRYTRWDDTAGGPKRRRDQVEFLIGFSIR